jgi:hypothetical protein
MDMLINQDKSLKNKEEFELASGFQIPEIKYQRLLGLARTALNMWQKTGIQEQVVDTPQNFCMRIKKGSKKFRKILSATNNRTGISTNCLKFAELIDLVIDTTASARLNSLWYYNFLDNGMRTFLFNLHNNQLGINSRVAHFVRNHPNTCTFCDIFFLGF